MCRYAHILTMINVCIRVVIVFVSETKYNMSEIPLMLQIDLMI